MEDHQTPEGAEDELRADEPAVETDTSPELEARRRRADMLDGTREVRKFTAEGLEVREVSDGMLRFTGYASVTERGYDVAGFKETIARGAFRRTLGENPDVVLLINHGEGGGLPLARTKSGTMTLSEDSRGLRVDADLNPDDPDVKALVPKLQRGDVDEMSFAFRVTDQDWSEDRTKRLIRSVALHKGDVSIVTYGANDASVGGLRALDDAELEQRAGKTLSAKTRAELEAAKERIDGLLAESAPEEPAGPSEVAAEAVPEQVTEVERAAESAPEAAQVRVMPNFRERERLAALRRPR